MRFYNIACTDSTTGLPINLGSKSLALAQFTSFLTPTGLYQPQMLGMTLAGALNIEIDIPIVSLDIPAGNGYIKIHGVSLDMVNNASKLNYQNITIYGGFQNGLPLANVQANAQPPRNGIIFQGSIYQAFGNWIGNDQTLEMFIGAQLAPLDTPASPTNISFTCPTGAPIGDAIQLAMESAGLIVTSVDVSPLLVPSHDLTSFHSSVNGFAQQMNDYSMRILAQQPNYLGIKIIQNAPTNPIAAIPTYTVTDATIPSAGIPIPILFYDLIGQPVWLDFNTLQMKLMMRSDISVGNYVLMPTGVVNIQSAQGMSQLKNNIAYTGLAYVDKVRHLGNFRQADGNSWCTVVDLIPITVQQ